MGVKGRVTWGHTADLRFKEILDRWTDQATDLYYPQLVDKNNNFISCFPPNLKNKTEGLKLHQNIYIPRVPELDLKDKKTQKVQVTIYAISSV